MEVACSGGWCHALLDTPSELKDLSTHAGTIHRKSLADIPLLDLPQLKRDASLKITSLSGATCVQEWVDKQCKGSPQL